MQASAVTPRLSLRYDLSEGTNVYFTFSKGFKTAVIAGFEQSDVYAKPETIKSYEVGLKSVGERYRVSTAVYYYDYKDQQAQFWNGTGSILGNAKTTKMTGMELDAQYKVTSGLLVQGGFSWLPKAEYGQFSGLAYYPDTMGPNGMTPVTLDMTGKRVIKAPEFTANLTVSYAADTSIGLITPSFNAFHTSALWFDVARQVSQGAYTTINANVQFKPKAVERLELTVFARNLTNKAFFTSTLLGPTSNAPVYSPPRQIGLGAAYKF